jgi:hypothetical protein
MTNHEIRFSASAIESLDYYSKEFQLVLGREAQKIARIKSQEVVNESHVIEAFEHLNLKINNSNQRPERKNQIKHEMAGCC